MTRTERLAELLRQWHGQIAYLKLKVDGADWHGVQDAASDLRDIEAEMKGLHHEDTSNRPS